MARRRRWIRHTLLATLVALLVGRWLAVRTEATLWAEALGVSGAHTAIANLRMMLAALAFSAAAVWCIGNLYLVYRSIGSVQVPRRLGNIEIVETVPRRFLLYGAVGVGLILAFAMSHGGGEWWSARALLDAGVVTDVRDPVLDRDVAYYLFRLPWLRALHGYVLLLTGVMLAIITFLYVAVGAIRWAERRLSVTDLARTHVGGLLVAFAMALYWGYRLEPAEMVAGLHNVPYDTILTDIRIPVARVLGGLALVVAATSAIWIWLGHTVLVVVAWGALAVGSFTGHYIAPAFAAAGRAPAQRRDPALDAAAARFVGAAFALSGDTTRAALAIPDAQFTTRWSAALGRVPIWDPHAVTMILNYTAQPRAFDRFFDASLGVYADGADRVPLFLAVREVDRDAARESERDISWERRHGRPYARAGGALAVHATRVTEEGLPAYVPDLGRPDSTTGAPAELAIATPDVWFSPAAAEFAVARPDDGPFAGTRAGGFFRRLALAWSLQSPGLLSAARVESDAFVLANRAVGDRLGRFAPFARFGGAYPVVADGVLLWVAAGYVWSESYPLSARVPWRGRDARYLHGGLLGVVEAHSGATAVYLMPDADPLSRAWAALAPGIVRAAEDLPDGVRAAMRYPDELFRVQLALLRRGDWRPGTPPVGTARAPEPFWWAGPAPGDSTVRLRLRAVIEVQLQARVAAVVDGAVVDGHPRLGVIAYPEPYTLTGPSDLVREFAANVGEEAAIPGPLKLLPFPDGAVGVQAFYAGPGAAGVPPRLSEVVVGWPGAVGRGPTLGAALRRVRIERAVARPPDDDAWADARAWFDRLDAARIAGDWTAFGEAYAALRRLLGPPADTGR